MNRNNNHCVSFFFTYLCAPKVIIEGIGSLNKVYIIVCIGILTNMFYPLKIKKYVFYAYSIWLLENNSL